MRREPKLAPCTLASPRRSHRLARKNAVRFHHLGVAAADPDKAIAFIRAGWPVTAAEGPIHDPAQDVDIVMLTMEDGARIEIVSGPRIAPYVQRGQILYHSCFETDDLEVAIARLRAAGALAVTTPQPAVLFGGRRVSFLNTKIGLVELLEANRQEEVRS